MLSQKDFDRMSLLIPPGPCNRRSQRLARDEEYRKRGITGGIDSQESVMIEILSTGGYMEDVGKLLQLAAKELASARSDMRKATKEVSDISEVVIPALTEQVEHVRSLRMTLSSEMKQVVTSLLSVREFFADHKYEAEMKRIESFMALCEYMKKLKKDGTLDAVADTAIRLAIKEEEKNGRQ